MGNRKKLFNCFIKAILTIACSFIIWFLLKFGAWLLINYLILGIIFFAIGLILFLTFLYWLGDD